MLFSTGTSNKLIYCRCDAQVATDWLLALSCITGVATGDGALASVPAGRGADTVRRHGHVLPAVGHPHAVAALQLRDVGHAPRPVPVVVDTGWLGLPVLVLRRERDGQRVS